MPGSALGSQRTCAIAASAAWGGNVNTVNDRTANTEQRRAACRAENDRKFSSMDESPAGNGLPVRAFADAEVATESARCRTRSRWDRKPASHGTARRRHQDVVGTRTR